MMDDHSLLIEINTKVDALIKHFENHLHQHYQILILCIGSMFTGGIAIVGWLIKLIWFSGME